MEQTINISNSVDYQLMDGSTTQSENEFDSQYSSLDPNCSTSQCVVNQFKKIDTNFNNNLPLSTTLITPKHETTSDISSSGSESSLVRPLLEEKHQTLPIYTQDLQIKSPLISICSYSFLKLYIIDMLISAFIITPLVNIHWRGAWDFLDIHLLPNNEYISGFISLFSASIILYITYLTQNILQNYYDKYRKTSFQFVLSRSYTLIIALTYINQWRGLWNLLDLTTNQQYYLLIETLTSVFILLLMKSTNNLNSAPFLIAADNECSFLLGSKYNLFNNRFWQYTFDFIFYELFEAPLLVIAWRGLYNLSDLYIFPGNKLVSLLTSFAIGYSSYFILVLIQIPILSTLLRYNFKRLYFIITTIFHLLAFVSVVQIWRCLWMICERYINIPGHSDVTLWLCYIVAYIVLISSFATCSLNGPGGTKDIYINGEPALIFKFEYLSTLLKSPSVHSTIQKNTKAGSDSLSTDTIIPVECSSINEPP